MKVTADAKKVALREDYSNEFSPIKEWLKPGTKLTLIEDTEYFDDNVNQHAYYHVKMKGGIEGYIRKDAVTL